MRHPRVKLVKRFPAIDMERVLYNGGEGDSARGYVGVNGGLSFLMRNVLAADSRASYDSNGRFIIKLSIGDPVM